MWQVCLQGFKKCPPPIQELFCQRYSAAVRWQREVQHRAAQLLMTEFLCGPEEQSCRQMSLFAQKTAVNGKT